MRDIAQLLADQPFYPVAALPSLEQAKALVVSGSDGFDKLQAILDTRRQLVKMAEHDPMEYGHYLRSWQRADDRLAAGDREIAILGGNRSAKTEYCARKVVQTLMERERRRAWCFHENLKVSRSIQQSRIYKFLPPSYRAMGKKGRTTKISYTQATGFSEETFVLPNGSQCWFMLYSADPKQIEGEELDIAWCDELVPLQVLQTLRFRLATRAGILLVSFTPIDGLTPTMREIRTNAEPLETVEARHLPLMGLNPDGTKTVTGYERVPTIEKCRRPKSSIVYFHTEDNPFGNPEEVVSKVDPTNRAEIRVRLYGLTDKAQGNLFPKFRRDRHVIPRDRVAGPGTWYHIVDPCNGRNFFMVWVWVNALDRKVVVREWPAEEDYIEGVGYPGPWAEVDAEKFDGKPGPAQRPFGLTLREYQAEIARVERELADPAYRPGATQAEIAAGTIPVAERFMDSRFGNTPTLSKSENLTLIEEFADLGLDFLPAPGEFEREGITAINDALGGYDLNQPIGTGNEPGLFVTRDCGNVIFSLENYTGQDGQKGAMKDPVDVLRYALLARLDYLDHAHFQPHPGPMLGSGKR